MSIKEIYRYTPISCVLFALSASTVSAGTMETKAISPTTDAFYIGVFGGGGSITSTYLSQQGTAFYPDIKGGPLAVNATGESNSNSAWLIGGHGGYRWSERTFNHINSNWTFAPAAELEGYYLGGAILNGDDLNNGTTRLSEHYFYVSYPTSTSIFLVNAILNSNHADLDRFHPYIGVGAGTAVIAISGANSIQKIPTEPGINHYNSSPSDTSIAFAAQPKMGVSFNLNQNTTVFVEYRFLYLSPSDFTFGSTVYPAHVATSNWDIKIGSQYYNMGTIGIQYDL